MITYQIGNDDLNLDEVIELYQASTLGERRPVNDRDRMKLMLKKANLVITARHGTLFVGIARSLSDFSYVTYLSDLAVRASHQKQGIGRELIRQTQKHGGQATVILVSAPKAVEYYPGIGMTLHPSAWTLKAEEQLK